jgi:hypothetical protein
MAETSTAQQVLDREMIARIGRRDQSAFSALYDRLSGPLYSLIAASIVFVGIENLLRGDIPKVRRLVLFGFGLIHSFGFA